MSADSNTFLMPREQSLRLAYLSLGAHRDAWSSTLPDQRHFFFWGRNALYHALHALGVPRSARALLPAFVCRAAAEPFAAYGLKCDYYEVRRNCTVDFAEIDAKLRSDTRVVLAVHYFGFPQQIDRFRKLCDRTGALLFEDCAHVLRSDLGGRPLGSFGDASVFSYRKFLPVFDGAELRIARPNVTLGWKPERSDFTWQAARTMLSQAIAYSPSLAAKFALRLINVTKRSLRRGPLGAPENPPSNPVVDGNSATFDLSLVNQPMTGFSRFILEHSNIPVVVARRRHNFLYLHEHVQRISGLDPLFRDLPQDVCPWVYPLFVRDVPDAHLHLRKLGVPAVTWGGVRVEGLSKEEFPDADFLYSNLVFLPVHQNLSIQDLQCMLNALDGLCSRRFRTLNDEIVAAGKSG